MDNNLFVYFCELIKDGKIAKPPEYYDDYFPGFSYPQ